jgi:hypothetical protein
MTVLVVRYQMKDDGVADVEAGIPAARELQLELKDWVLGEPSTPQPLQVPGAYRLVE